MRVARAAATVLCALVYWAAPSSAAVAGGNSDGGATVNKQPERTYEGRAHIGGERASKRKTTPAAPGHKRTLTKIVLKKTDRQLRKSAITVMCREATDAGISCTYTPPKKKTRQPARLALDLNAVARTLITRIQLPDPSPQIGPDPSANEWKMAAVGYPLWLWTAGPRTVTDRVRAYGVTFTLRATWVSSHFRMGDGHSVTCTTAQPYPKRTKPGTASPHCGYTYLTASLPRGNYTLTATTNWRITWRALGRSGTMPGSFSATRSLPVGELNALVVK